MPVLWTTSLLGGMKIFECCDIHPLNRSIWYLSKILSSDLKCKSSPFFFSNLEKIKQIMNMIYNHNVWLPHT